MPRSSATPVGRGRAAAAGDRRSRGRRSTARGGGRLAARHHVPVPHVPRRAALAAGVLVIAVAGVATVGLVARPASPSAPAIPYTPGHADLAMPGEFLLGPGNLAPIGIAVALPPDLVPMRGEFRLGPGLAQPPGISWPMQQTMTRVEPLYAAGEFVLGLGNQAPMGIVVPLYGTAAPRVPAPVPQ